MCVGDRSHANKQTHCAHTPSVTRHGVLLRGDKVARRDNPLRVRVCTCVRVL